MFRLFLDSLRTALRSMVRRPVRTLLVLQGMIWGTAVAIMPPAIIEGSRRAVLEEAGRVGTDRVIVTSDSIEDRQALVLDDLRFLQERFGTSIAAAAPFRIRHAAFRAGDSAAVGWVVGTTPDAARVLGRELSEGSMFGDGPGEGVADACLKLLLSPEGGVGPPGEVSVYFNKEDPYKTDIRAFQDKVKAGELRPDLAGMRLAGVLAPAPRREAGIDDFGFKRKHFLSGMAAGAMRNMGVLEEVENWRDGGCSLFMSIGALPAEGDRVDMIMLRARPDGMSRFLVDLQKALSERGRSPLVRSNVLAPVLLEGRVDKYIRLRYATFVLCLAMGAIVISNVMLFSVLENMREIAIRRAEGATAADIVLQHLFHAAILATTGGLLGIPAGLLVARMRIMLAPSAAMGVAMPWDSAAIAVACTVAAGVLAGVLPARRAAKLDPAEVLRAE